MRRWVRLSVAAVVMVPLVVIAGYFPLGVSKAHHDVDPEDLFNLIDRSDRVVVLQDSCKESAVLFESSERADLDALKASLHLERPEQNIRCKCDGTPAIYLYSRRKLIGEFTNHHMISIGLSFDSRYWNNNARIVDAEALLKWFDERKIPGPRAEYEKLPANQKGFEWGKRKD